MAINVFGSSCSSHGDGDKIDTISFVQKPYLRTNYIESNLAGVIDFKNHFR